MRSSFLQDQVHESIGLESTLACRHIFRAMLFQILLYVRHTSHGLQERGSTCHALKQVDAVDSHLKWWVTDKKPHDMCSPLSLTE